MEAAQRLETDGPNELGEGERLSRLQIFLGQFRNLIIWILIAAGVISAVLGDVLDAIAIFAIVVLNAFIGFHQELRPPESLSGAPSAPKWSNLAAGAAVILLSVRRGPVGERYGSWQRFIR